MSLRIHGIPESVLASYEAAAKARGISLDALIRESLIRSAPAPPPAALSTEEWERALEECFDSFPPAGPLPDSAFDRETLYSREDQW